MNNLGVLLADQDPAAARRWYEQAAEAGHTGAMINLGVLLADRTRPQPAAGMSGPPSTGTRTHAMFNLGVLLARQRPGRSPPLV